jgi:hypothetical protein
MFLPPFKFSYGNNKKPPFPIVFAELDITSAYVLSSRPVRRYLSSGAGQKTHAESTQYSPLKVGRAFQPPAGTFLVNLRKDYHYIPVNTIGKSSYGMGKNVLSGGGKRFRAAE